MFMGTFPLLTNFLLSCTNAIVIMDDIKTYKEYMTAFKGASDNVSRAQSQLHAVRTSPTLGHKNKSASAESLSEKKPTLEACYPDQQHRDQDAGERSDENAQSTESRLAKDNTKYDRGPVSGFTPATTNKTSTADTTEAKKKKRATSSTPRLGQACDRCKIRKIKCDDSPTRCSSCAKHDVVCKTTDRNTGKVML